MPVFVLTHHAREPIEMEGGTTFHFVTDGIHAALERAREAAARARTFASAAAWRRSGSTCAPGLVDELHLAIAPALLGAGEALFAGIDLPALGYRVQPSTSATPKAMHVVLTKRD